MMDGYGGHGWGMGWGWILGILVIVAIVWIAVNMVNQNRRSGHEKTPLDVLNERYARGEIDKKEYEERKRDLQS